MAASRTGRPSDKYGRDLTRLAQEGRLDPVLCRDAELDRMIEILCRRQKNNPCLLGEPGVGKSALAEALAQRIAAGQITPALRGKRVLALDMASMVAGTKYRGDFEERFKNLLEELYRDRSTILFIDEIHLIAGAGAAEGAIDAASILKPMLARGEIQLIGKARGSKQGNNLLVQKIHESGGIDFDEPIILGYSGLSDSYLKKYVEDSRDIWQDKADSLDSTLICSVIGTHTGPGVVAVAFFKKG